MHFPDNLLQGYYSFLRKDYSLRKKQYENLAEHGQTPTTMVIACCDSRVSPEMIFNVEPGELFILSNVANLVPPYCPDETYHSTSAAIEYGVKKLNVRSIIVLGHSLCGGVCAALNNSIHKLQKPDFIDKWMSFLSPAAEVFRHNKEMDFVEKQKNLEQLSIRFSLTNLRTFPFVAFSELQGNLTLYGLWFDIRTRELKILDTKAGEFESLAKDCLIDDTKNGFFSLLF